MEFSIAEFTRVAKNNWFNNDLVLTGDRNGLTSQFFHSKSSVPASAQMNNKVMEAFHRALTREFGSFGEEAWKTVLEDRYCNDQSLRKSDVLKAVKRAESGHTQVTSGVRAVAESRLTEVLMDRRAYSASAGIPWETRKAIFPKLVERITHDVKTKHHLMSSLTIAIRDGVEGGDYDPMRNYLEDLLNEVKARLAEGRPVEELVDVPDENDVLANAAGIDEEGEELVNSGRYAMRYEDSVRSSVASEESSVSERSSVESEDDSVSERSSVASMDEEPRPRAETTVFKPRTILHGQHRSNSVSDLNP